MKRRRNIDYVWIQDCALGAQRTAEGLTKNDEGTQEQIKNEVEYIPPEIRREISWAGKWSSYPLVLTD